MSEKYRTADNDESRMREMEGKSGNFSVQTLSFHMLIATKRRIKFRAEIISSNADYPEGCARQCYDVKYVINIFIYRQQYSRNIRLSCGRAEHVPEVREFFSWFRDMKE